MTSQSTIEAVREEGSIEAMKVAGDALRKGLDEAHLRASKKRD